MYVQWLQENCLCLLSNAVKYSSRLDVRITVTRVQGLKYGGSGDTTEKDDDSNKSISPKSVSARQLHAFSLPNTTTATTTCTEVHLPGYLMFEVTDTGIGISDDKIKTLFAPFQQAQRFAGGTGLGLFSLARRVEAQHGACGVRKRDDGVTGSVFWFMLPYIPDPTMEQECMFSSCSTPLILSAVGSPTIGKSLASGRSDEGHTDRESSRSLSTRAMGNLFCPTSTVLNILLVDDSISVMKTTRMMLTKQGHTVDTAVNGADALEKMVVKHYDIVLMDIQVYMRCFLHILTITLLLPFAVIHDRCQ